MDIDADWGNIVISRFGGEHVSDVDQPLGSKDYPEKGRKNSIRANNISRRYARIREILRVRGYRVPDNTGSVNVLQIGALFPDFLTVD